MARRDSFEEASSAFRAHLPDLTSPRFATAAKQTIYEYTKSMQDQRAPPWLYDLTKTWEKLLAEPFTGITNDGTVRERLFSDTEENADVASATNAARDLLDSLSPEQREKLLFAVNAREWRAWSNPEFLLRPLGLRLEEVPKPTVQSILAVVASSLSPEGYQKALSAMRINHFLGELVRLPAILNQHSYNFLLFGSPSTSPSSPWGWLLYGHHLCLACFFKGNTVTLTPTFIGAEPNIIDAGKHQGTTILHHEAHLARSLMQSLPPSQQATAQLYAQLRHPAMKQVYATSGHDAAQADHLITDTWTPDDQRHLCGAFRDNRVVPYAGVCAANLGAPQQSQLLALVAEFLAYHPRRARAHKLQQVQRHLRETYFCWVGAWGAEDAFYFRVQSPVLLVEFDHHSGVFLTNEAPAKYHTHTIVRTPNAGDYGQAVREGKERLA